jgi:hypothetical protein
MNIMVNLLEYFRSFLLQTPPYTSTFLLVQEWQEPLLVMRVEEFTLFQQEDYHISIGFQTWCTLQGTWVVAVPFRIDVHPQLSVRGMPCLNPRSAVDYEMMKKFSTEEHLCFLFLSCDLNDAESVQIPWPVEQRRVVQQHIQEIDRTFTGRKFIQAFDPDFEQARQEFLALYGQPQIDTLLAR